MLHRAVLMLIKKVLYRTVFFVLGVKPRCYLRPSLPQFGESIRVTLTYVASPHDFYVQVVRVEKLRNFLGSVIQ